MGEAASRSGALKRADDYFTSGKFEEELGRRVAIRTESQRRDSTGELHRYIDEDLSPTLAAMGFVCRKFDNPVDGCGPVLLATRIEGGDLPTVLGYGHGDVIQGLDDQWSKGEGPWTIARDGERIYGRGTADNKGQHTINIAAMRAVLEERGRLGFNAKFMIETGEENGSQGLHRIVQDNRDDFAADVLIASDGPRLSPSRPTLTLGARGAINFDLVCDLREGGHHSGNWGGLLASPSVILCNAIAAIVGPTGRIKIREWLPPPMSESVREALHDVTVDAGADGPEIDPDWGEPGLTPAERVYAWNSFDVLTILAGTPDRPVNAVPPWARAHCQLRYFAGTDAEGVLPALRRHLDVLGFDRVRIEPPPPHNAGDFPGTRTEPDDPWAVVVKESMSRTLGDDPVVLPSMGGSICNDVFTDILGLPALWVPHSYAGCSQHAPNEHILLPVTRSALQIMAGIYWDLGEGRVPGKEAAS